MTGSIACTYSVTPELEMDLLVNLMAEGLAAGGEVADPKPPKSAQTLSYCRRQKGTAQRSPGVVRLSEVPVEHESVCRPASRSEGTTTNQQLINRLCTKAHPLSPKH